MKKYLLAIAVVLFATFTAAQAAEIGHFNGGVMDIRDYFLPPESGLYGVVYNYYARIFPCARTRNSCSMSARPATIPGRSLIPLVVTRSSATRAARSMVSVESSA
jgi:hypothetical protein